jgi:hypothetical protein
MLTINKKKQICDKTGVATGESCEENGRLNMKK